jgi:hypothetical protein
MPCCWITGSATPSSLTRLCSVVMFCLTAWSWMRRPASGFNVPTSLKPSPSAVSTQARSARLSVNWLRAASAAARSRTRTSTLLPSRVTAARMLLSRSSVRASPAKASAFFVSAAFMSTCIRKCTPPRRSRPRYIGSARTLAIHFGERETRLSATMYGASFGSEISALLIASRALSWVSVSAKRARTDVPSSATKSAFRLADFNASCTRVTSAASTFTVALADDTCTAGDSPKKFGAV